VAKGNQSPDIFICDTSPPLSQIDLDTCTREKDSMPSVIGSPTRTYTPPSSNDESLPLHYSNASHTSVPHNSKLHPHSHSHPSSSSTSLNIHTTTQHNNSNPASPPSSSDDSPTTSTGGTFTYLSGQDDDTEMLDYNYNPTLPLQTGDSSPEALFFASSTQQQQLNRFTSAEDTGLSPFSAALAGLKGNGSSPEYAVEGDSPGLGTEMRGLRLNSRFPSPVQGTVRLEDVMLPSEDNMGLPNGALFAQEQYETKPQVQHVENGLFQR
jgi:hypothetical protein